jgi:hypothetical protein
MHRDNATTTAKSPILIFFSSFISINLFSIDDLVQICEQIARVRTLAT